ncbi:MAG TPA: HD domain-containing phosphohydrolase [Longimicrobium sp.]|jgi:putative nucleotidyltransferase with HDIG domain
MRKTHPASRPTTAAAVTVLVADGQAAERDGRRAEACELYERALHALGPGGDRALACGLLRWIARCHLDDGDAGAAADSAAAALAMAEACGDQAGVAHALNLQGNIAREKGELEAAEALYLRALGPAAAAGEARLLAMLEQNIGIVANIRGDYRAALKRYRASLAGHRALGQDLYAAHVLNNLGMLYTDLRRWRAAERAYRDAVGLCVALGDAATQARVEGNRTELLIAQRRWDEARHACEAAYALARAVGDPSALGETHKHFGMVARETGDWAAAERHLRSAAQIADERGDLLLGAEAARELAALHWCRHEHRETLQELNRSHRLFSRLQARRDLADVDARLAELEETFLHIVTLWGQSIESADRYTQGHCERVADRACALARAVGMDEKTLFWFRMGALLHDVGKIVVPPEILNKAGPLTDEEREVMQRHPEAGVALIEEIEFPWDIRPMVRHHHEAWDGGGYPAGLAGEEIPLSARILCVADIYDALSTDRPYRRGFSHRHTLEVMASEAGRTIDPELFAVFRSLDFGCDDEELPAAA